MVTMRAVRTGPRSLDLGLSLLAGLITGIGSVTTVAAWLPHDAIIPLAAAQGVMLLARSPATREARRPSVHAARPTL
jgi:hypothetical protein